jgi:uncharacterized protein YerC
MKNRVEVENVLAATSDPLEIRRFLEALLTATEMGQLEHRWAAMQLVLDGATQREVRDNLRISIATASRSAQLARANKTMIESVLKKTKARKDNSRRGR